MSTTRDMFAPILSPLAKNIFEALLKLSDEQFYDVGVKPFGLQPKGCKRTSKLSLENLLHLLNKSLYMTV